MVNPLIIGEHVRLVASASGLRRARRRRQRWLQPSTVVLLVLLPIVLHCPHCHPCRHYPHRRRRQHRCWHRCVVVIVAGGIVRPSRPLIAPAGCCVSPLSPYHRAPPSCPLSSRCERIVYSSNQLIKNITLTPTVVFVLLLHEGEN